MFDLPVDCVSLDFAQMAPAYSEYVYEFLGPNGQPMGMQTTFRVAQAGPGSWRVSERSSVEPPGARSRQSYTRFRYAILPESVLLAPEGSGVTYDYGRESLADMMVLESGETVELPVTLRLRNRGEESVLSDTYTISHEGCTNLEIRGESVQVHRVRFDRFSHRFDASGRVSIRRTESIKDYAPQYGWWVRETIANVGGTMLVDVVE
jgi:hypothetical protein